MEPLRRAVATVAALNAGYFAVELTVALAIGSVSLFADSADFAEDAAVNLLIVFALSWSAVRRARVGKALAFVLLLPLAGFAYGLYQKVADPLPPEPVPLGLAGAGALAVNITCALLLLRYRSHRGSLTRAAFLSARNDIAAGVAIVAAGLLTAVRPSIWPDIVVGVGVAAMNLGAARDVWRAATAEGLEMDDVAIATATAPGRP